MQTLWRSVFLHKSHGLVPPRSQADGCLSKPWFSCRATVLQQPLLPMALPGASSQPGSPCYGVREVFVSAGVSAETVATQKCPLAFGGFLWNVALPQVGFQWFQWTLGSSLLRAAVLFLPIWLLLRGLFPQVTLGYPVLSIHKLLQ